MLNLRKWKQGENRSKCVFYVFLCLVTFKTYEFEISDKINTELPRTVSIEMST